MNDYDFHARFQNPAGPFFQSADRHAGNDPARSPWTFAAANPVRFTDPTGLDIYQYDIKANLIKIEPNDKDLIIIATEQTRVFEKGTIKKAETIVKADKDMDYLIVNNNEVALEIFEFIVENTIVEISLVSYEIEGKKEFSYIGSSHQEEDEKAGVQIIADNFEQCGNIPKDYIHCHQSGYLWSSEGDRNVVKGLQQKYDIMFNSKIYTKERYEKLGNYKSYTPNSAKLTTEFFDFKYKNPKAPKF